MGYRFDAYARGCVMVVKIVVAWIAIGFISYGAMWACASEAHCGGGCKAYHCSSSMDCGLSCDCVRINDTWDGTCVENW